MYVGADKIKTSHLYIREMAVINLAQNLLC